MSNCPQPTPDPMDEGFSRAQATIFGGLLVLGGASGLVWNVAYHFFILLLVGLGWTGWRQRGLIAEFLKQRFRVLLVLVLPALWLQAHLSGDWQDWAEETPLAAASLRLHLDRDANVPLAAIFAYPEGPLLLGDGGSAGLFPALVSLLHDVAGERPANARLLNGLLAYGLLVSLWLLLRKVSSVPVSVAVLVLFLFTPLLSLEACSGSSQLLLALLFVQSVLWWLNLNQSPMGRFSRLLHLALTSLGFLFWFGLVAQDLNQPFQDALETTLFRLFSPEAQEPGSALLMLAGMASGLLLLLSLKAPAKAGETVSPKVVLLTLGLLSIVGFLCALGHEWSAVIPWHAPHTLLLHVAAALALAWALGRRDREKPLPWKWLAPLLGFGLMMWAMPRLTEPVSALSLKQDGRRVLRDFAREQPKHVSAFYAMDRPEGLIVEGFSAGPVELVAPYGPNAGLSPLLASRLFEKFYVLATATRRPEDGGWEPDTWQKLPSGLETKVVRERWITADRKAFVHEVTGIRQNNGILLPPFPPSSGPKMSRTEISKWLEAKSEESP